MFHHNEPHYEFRIFAPDLTSIASHLAAMTHDREEGTTAEIYIVTRLNADSNVKLREGRLDLKILKAHSGILELWEPVLSAELPVSVQTFKNQVVAHLGVEFGMSDHSRLSESELHEFVDTNPALAWLPIHKKRVRFKTPPGWSEFVDLSIGNSRLQSVAVEAREADAAHHLVDRAGIGSYRNESYPCFLQAIAFD